MCIIERAVEKTIALWSIRLIAPPTIILMFCISLYAQDYGAYQRLSFDNYKTQREHSAYDSTNNGPSQSRYWIAAAEVVGTNLGVWGYFRFVEKEDYTKISMQTIRNNFRTGFWWDQDGFMGNQFNHPYHGSAYFNSARSNGLSFWESALYPLGGSAMWEFFMEVEPPSYNDIVNTPVSGIILGEISYRVTDLLLDDSKRGVERIVRELSSFLLNPMRGINRIVRGEMWREGPPSPRPDYRIWLSIGGNNVFEHRTLSGNHGYALIRFDMDYGDPLATSNHNAPFDYFNVRGELSISKNDNIFGVFASGVLWDRRVTLLQNSSDALGVYKEFDLLRNTVYRLTATSVTFRLTNTMSLSSSVSLENSLSVSAILMGGVNSQYASLHQKEYNIGPGASARVGTLWKIQKYGSVYLNYKQYWLHTLNGAKSEEFIGLLNIGTNYTVSGTTMIGFDFLLYDRYGSYTYLPHIKSSNSAIRLYVKFSLR